MFCAWLKTVCAKDSERQSTLRRKIGLYSPFLAVVAPAWVAIGVNIAAISDNINAFLLIVLPGC